jgi:hypothetical protein
VKPDVEVPSDQALDEALRRAGVHTNAPGSARGLLGHAAVLASPGRPAVRRVQM